MGTGKSAVARHIASVTGRALVEMDERIETKEGMTVAEIFAKKGEKYFRGCERVVVQELCACEGFVISTGGGVVLNKDNIADFRAHGVVVCLRARPETVLERVKLETHRPLLQTDNPLEKIKTLLEKRRPYYAMADVAVDTDGKSVEAVAKEVMRIVDGAKELP